MWFLALPRSLRYGLAGMGLAFLLAGMVWGYLERRDAQTRQAERDRAALQQAIQDRDTRARIRDADRSAGDADEDHNWLCVRFGVDCVREADD